MNIIGILVCRLSTTCIRDVGALCCNVMYYKSNAAHTLACVSVCAYILVSKDQVNEMIIINDNIIETNNKITTVSK